MFQSTDKHRSTSEPNVLAVISRVGTPTGKSSRSKKKTLKSVAQTLIFLSRIRKAAQTWSEQSAAKAQLALALDDVRKRRAVVGGRKSAGVVESSRIRFDFERI